MFDIGFAELVMIGVVGLLVIGPERLPTAIRTCTLWLNRLKRGFNDIKQEVKQELHNDEVMRDLRSAGQQLKEQTGALGKGLDAPGTDPGQSAPAKPEPVDPALTQAETSTAAVQAEQPAQPPQPGHPGGKAAE